MIILSSMVCVEFTNPYGIRSATGVSSQSSSDRLSQFGTARDYHDFDMQNDLSWYEEKDEDYPMPPIFNSSDSFGDPSEDKFVMTTEKQRDDLMVLNHISEGFQSVEGTNYLDKPWPFTSIDDVKDEVHVRDYYNLDESVPLKGGVDLTVNSLTNFNRAESDEPSKCLSTLDHKTNKNWSSPNKRNSIYDSVGHFKNTSGLNTKVVEKDFYPSGNDGYEAGNDRDEAAADEEDSTRSDELLTYVTNEDEYEVFSLRIIHRKNRFVIRACLPAKFVVICKSVLIA